MMEERDEQPISIQQHEPSVLPRMIFFVVVMLAFLTTLALMFVHPPAALGIFFGTLLVVGVVWGMTRLIGSEERASGKRRHRQAPVEHGSGSQS